MEALQRTSSKTTKTFLTLHKRLQEIEAEIIQFTNLPIDTPSLDLLAQHIEKKFGFIRNFLNAEIASYGTTPDDLSEIEGRLTELEAEFYRSNMHSADFHGKGDSESGSGSDSICESCLNNDRDCPSEAGSDVSSVYEAPEMLYEVVVPPPEVFYESTMPPSNPEKVECKPEKTGVGKRRWCRTVAVLTTVSAALMVSFVNSLYNNQHDGFLTPT